MDILNLTDEDLRYKVTSGGSSAQGRLKPKDYAVVRPPQEAPWTVSFQVRGAEPIAKVVRSPKASVALGGEVGNYHVKASVSPIDALIIYTPSIKKWAEKLDVALREQGLSAWIDYRDLKAGVSAWEQLEKAIDKTKNIVVLIGAKDDATERQRIAGAVALEAVYKDSSKRMIPLLLGNAGLPAFVRTAAYGTRPIPSIRIANPGRDWARVIADLVEILKGEADPRTKGEVFDTAEEDLRLWQERMDYIGRVAAELRVQEDRARLKRLSAKTA